MDPRATGRGGPDATVVDAGVIRLNPRWSVADRLVELYADVQGLIARHKPDLIAVEALFTHYDRPSSVIVMGHARGVILLAARQASLALVELRPTEVKKSICGHGQAKKGQIQKAVMTELGLDALPKPADVADALAIALCAMRRGQF